jgi:hypothetical protein
LLRYFQAKDQGDGQPLLIHRALLLAREVFRARGLYQKEMMFMKRIAFHNPPYPDDQSLGQLAVKEFVRNHCNPTGHVDRSSLWIRL